MKKVGLVTLWKRNYGSALQCYATKYILERMGYQCILLYRTFPGIKRYTYYVCELLRLIFKSFRYKGYFTKYMSFRAAGKRSIGGLSQKSEEAVDHFVEENLKPKGYSYSDLKKIGESEEYVAFLAGSDQIWNGSKRYDPVSFLDFVSRKKKIALAPSFGGEIEKYNVKSFAKGIEGFSFISVREQDGVEKIKKLTGKNALCLSDPTTFLFPDEWRDFCESVENILGEYIFIHFLDKPCDTAIQTIKELRFETRLPIVAFAYPHEEYEGIEGLNFYDGGPKEYVKFIDQAKYVMTDSFHTTLFSIYFRITFFTFHRQYTHSAKQTNRITNLLRMYRCEERLIGDIGDFRNALGEKIPDNSKVMEKERQKLIEYLKEALTD